jgi:hypothetical protein
VVFALAGVLVIEAAITYQPSKADGIDKALLTLRGPSIRAIPARQTQSADPATRPMSLLRVGGVQCRGSCEIMVRRYVPGRCKCSQVSPLGSCAHLAECSP